ncbi:NAD-dependent epimerase/dehydratase family protein [Mycobacterium paragordonae]|uniref:NAD-dependent epimerase/dehydratase family protein n=1 Tax=Mycobacterium paragordonae TaxID=1389713 RepID=UPI0010623296|nr:NAD-dependent epimerase/dehydratase family protein [Mycobacterium paragordonae]TDK87068.1 NAD-dependent epimerase/dehydratase family protein [Mycobacterium paragordonae]TDL00945.1 NAD-dependent epimerase/dehydratase family protein [Mycobacterium paragordonae]
MRVTVTGAGGVLGRGLVARLLSEGHEVTGIARRRPESWPSAARFVTADIRDADAVRRAVSGATVVAHCVAARGTDDIQGAANLLAAMAENGSGRIVFTSCAQIYGAGSRPATEDGPLNPTSSVGRQTVRVERMLADSGFEWVAIRLPLVVGRGVDNRLRAIAASPVLFTGSADGRIQVVHTDDALRLLNRAVLQDEIISGAVNLAAPGAPTVRQVAAALRRPVVPIGPKCALPLMDTTRLRDEWHLEPAWTAEECLQDFSLAVRGRVALANRVLALPWRLAPVQDLPAVDTPADDGVEPKLAGPEAENGEFDTPIDPRFPTYLATNLSEALPGPFSPSSASVTVRGLRAGGVGIAERLRPGGVVQKEIAMRTVAVFAHRLYGAITSAHFMAETVPFAKPATIVSNSGFFGPSMASLPIFGEERPPSETNPVRRRLRTIRNIGVFGVNLVGLSAGSPLDTGDYRGDVERLEQLAGDDVTRLDDRRLLSLILLARDHVVHGWLLASGSFMLCAAFNVLLRGLCGRETAPSAGPELVSARSVEAMQRLALAARRDPTVLRVLAEPGERLDKLAVEAPEFHRAVLGELALMGHRGPAEVEMLSTSYADDPELLIRMVTKALSAPPAPEPRHAPIPLRAKLVALLAARQLRDREVRRDRMVRAIWVLRGLLREYGRRLTESGVFQSADDVFYLLVDELDALPANVSELIARRRAEQRRLVAVVPPTVFSGQWEPTTSAPVVLGGGDTLRGVGVCGGRVRGRVRIVRPETIDDLLPGEILVAEVTDVGYTAAFCYAAAVVTELGGPMSHAAVVAREFGFPCVVDVQGATRSLPQGALVEVDGATGEIRLLEP